MKQWWKDYLTDANGDSDGVALLAIAAFVSITLFAFYEVYYVVPHQPFQYLNYGTAVGMLFAGLGAKHKLEVKV